MKRFISILLSIAAVLCLFASCGENEAKSGKLLVVCTTFPQYDFAKNIAGDKAEIKMLDSASDIHSFEPTAADIITISQADVFICIGGVSDKWVDKALESSGSSSVEVLRLMDTVKVLNEETVEGMQAEEEEDEEADEHIWLSLKNAVQMVGGICNTLCAADPENASVYSANAESYTLKLNELDKQYEQTVASAKRKTVLFADRFPFRYLVEDYGLEYFAAFSGCSAETSASFETVAFLIEKTKELSLPVILVTESSDGKIAGTVSKDTGAKVMVMDSCQSVHMSGIESGENYIDIMTENLKVLGEALS